MGGTDDAVPQVRAAGGIILRAGKKEPKVLLIHRERYDDWSFPKGKLEDGESFKKAALREVLEETGMICRTHRPRLPELTYIDGQGRNKEVRYWLMTVRKGDFVPNDEVDLISWVRVSKVVDRLTYRRDQGLFESVVDSGRIAKII